MLALIVLNLCDSPYLTKNTTNKEYAQITSHLQLLQIRHIFTNNDGKNTKTYVGLVKK